MVLRTVISRSKHKRIGTVQRYMEPAEMLIQVEKKIENDVYYIKKQIIDIQYVGSRLSNLQDEQIVIENTLGELVEMQEKITTCLKT